MGNRILTNKYNLPDTLVKAVLYDTHDMRGATLSVTQLIDGAKIRYLKKLNDYEVDIIDCIDALLGTAIHHVLERANIDSVRQRAFILVAETLNMKADELRASSPEKASQLSAGANWLFKLIPIFFPELQQKYFFERKMFLTLGHHVLSGTFDLYDRETGILWDYKSCSTFMWSYPDARKKWIEQLNIYAYMLAQEGHQVTGIRVLAIFKDWNQQKALMNRDYPDKKIKEIVVPLYALTDIKSLIDYHMDLHVQAETGNVPDCSGEVRWATADEYAVMSCSLDGKDSKRALKKFVSRKAAESFIQEEKHRYSRMWVIDRPGESRRCAQYCPVNKFCDQYKRENDR